MSLKIGWLAKTVVLAASSAMLFVGCGDDDREVLVFNECGDVGELSLDGEEADPGEACGPCDRGIVTCDDSAEGGLRCHDPEPENACGGCDELDGAPGAQCVDGGDMGQWQCDGQEAVQCQVTFSNDCGGNQSLPAAPGDACGDCGLGHYQCDGGNAVICAEDPGCPEITNVNATQGSRSDGVRVTWHGSVWATGYRVYRDGAQIANLAAGTLSYLDTEADAAGAPEEVVVTASTDLTDGIEVTWHAEAGDAPTHTYQVEIMYPEGTSGRSDGAEGYRGSDVEGFELSINQGEWVDQGTETSLFVDDADMATVDGATIDVTGSGWDWLALATEEPTIIDADEYDFAVRATTAGGQLSEPGEATGQRAYGDVHYQWSATADGVSEDLDDCDDSLTCVDDNFPGSIVEKEYTFTVFGEGVESASFDLTASVDLLVLAADEGYAEYEVGSTAEFVVSITDAGGEAVAREGVELDFEISHPEIVDGTVPATLVTDEYGEASVELTFNDQAEDVTTTVTANDDPRVSDESVSHGPFDVTPPADDEPAEEE